MIQKFKYSVALFKVFLDEEFEKVNEFDKNGGYKIANIYADNMLNPYWKATKYQIVPKPDLFNKFDTVFLSGNDYKCVIAFGHYDNSQSAQLLNIFSPFYKFRNDFPGCYVWHCAFKTCRQEPVSSLNCLCYKKPHYTSPDTHELAASVVTLCKDTIKNVKIRNFHPGFNETKQNLNNFKIEKLTAHFDNKNCYAKAMISFPLEVEEYRLILDYYETSFSNLYLFDVNVKQSLFVKAYCGLSSCKEGSTKNPFLGNPQRPITTPCFSLHLRYYPRNEEINIGYLIKSILLWTKTNCSCVEDCNILIQFDGSDAATWLGTETKHIKTCSEDVIPDFKCCVQIFCRAFTPLILSFDPYTTVELINTI